MNQEAGVRVPEEELAVSDFYGLRALNAPDVHFGLGYEEWWQFIDAQLELNLLHTLAFLLPIAKKELLGY